MIFQNLLFRSVLVGLLAGALAGVFGVGGGFIMVPLFVLWIHLDQKQAQATSLFAVIFIAVFALLTYAHAGKVLWSYAGLIFTGAVAGTFLGVRIFRTISLKSLSNIFSALLLLVAFRLLWSSDPHHLVSEQYKLIALLLIGIASGTMAGLLGLGGGIVIVPALIIVTGVTSDNARGTSLIIIIATAILGTWLHRQTDHVQWNVGLTAGIAGIPTAIIGSKFGAASSNPIIMAVFAILLILVALQLFLRNHGVSDVSSVS